MSKKILALIAVGLLFIEGCTAPSARAEAVMAEGASAVGGNKAVISSGSSVPEFDKIVRVHAVKKPVYLIAKEVGEKIGLAFDSSFAPSEKYRLTINYKGKASGVYNAIERQTGVEYRFHNGVLGVANKGYVKRQYRAHSCSEKGAERMEINLRAVPPKRVFEYFAEKRNYTVSYDTRYYNLSGNSPKLQRIRNVNFKYSGCDEKEALHKFAKQNNLDIAFEGKRDITVRDFKTVKLDVPTYFNLKFTSSEGGVGGSSSTGTTLTDRSNMNAELKGLVKTYLGKRGKAFLSKSGYLVVTDTPRNIEEIQSVLKKEISSQKVIKMAVTIVRVDVKDGYKQGVDWGFVFSSLGKGLNIRNFGVGINTASQASGGLSISGILGGKNQIINLLSEYGKTKIVRSFLISARSGTVGTAKAVEKIPYVVTTVSGSGNDRSSSTEAREAEAGIIVNLKPSLSRKNEVVNLGVDITVSEYLGDKVFSVSGGTYVLPKITVNKIQIPTTVDIGKTVVLTGLRLKQMEVTKEGVPVLSKAKFLGGLFGYNADSAKFSDFLILITPTIAGVR